MIENVIITRKKIFVSAASDPRTEAIEKELNEYLQVLKKIQTILKDDK